MDEQPRGALPCETILIRSLIYPNLISKEDGSHKERAFIRRKDSDPQGMSVTTTIQEAKDALPRGIFGARSVHIGRLRDNGLDVIMDTPTHGNIRYLDGRLTPRDEDDRLAAQDLALLLLNCTRPIAYFNDADADERLHREIAAKRANQAQEPQAAEADQ